VKEESLAVVKAVEKGKGVRGREYLFYLCLGQCTNFAVVQKSLTFLLGKIMFIFSLTRHTLLYPTRGLK